MKKLGTKCGMLVEREMNEWLADRKKTKLLVKARKPEENYNKTKVDITHNLQ